MTVTANMAHAWPEVYIEGIGWLPFEPTPEYEEIRYTPWKMKEKKDNRFMMMLVSGFFAACFVCLLVLFVR